MEEALTYGAAAPFIFAVVALVRRFAPELRGRWVPLAVLALTLAWGGLLATTGRFTGDAAEFALATVAVASAAIGLASTVSTFAPDDSAVSRVT